MWARIDTSHFTIMLFLFFIIDQVEVSIGWVLIFSILGDKLTADLKVKQLRFASGVNYHDTVAWDIFNMPVVCWCHNMQLRYALVSRHSKTSQLVNFAILADLPEDHVALPANRHESLSAWEIFCSDYFFSMHCESAIELVELLAMEKKYGSFG